MMIPHRNSSTFPRIFARDETQHIKPTTNPNTPDRSESCHEPLKKRSAAPAEVKKNESKVHFRFHWSGDRRIAPSLSTASLSVIVRNAISFAIFFFRNKHKSISGFCDGEFFYQVGRYRIVCWRLKKGVPSVYGFRSLLRCSQNH